MTTQDHPWLTDADRLEDALSKLRAAETQRDALRVQLEAGRRWETADAIADYVCALNRLRRLEVKVEVDDVDFTDAVTDLGAVIRYADGKAHHAYSLTFDRDTQTWYSHPDLRAGQTTRTR